MDQFHDESPRPEIDFEKVENFSYEEAALTHGTVIEILNFFAAIRFISELHVRC